MELPSIIFGAWTDLAQNRDGWVLHFKTKLQGSVKWGELIDERRSLRLQKTLLRRFCL
jgi:hypothetical protein